MVEALFSGVNAVSKAINDLINRSKPGTLFPVFLIRIFYVKRFVLMEKPRNRTQNIGLYMNRIYPFILIITIALSTSYCSKTSDFQSDSVSSYMNFQLGKFIIYRLDSTVKKPFDDTAFIVRSYQAKDVMDGIITDNIGRPSWRVVRYLRDTGSSRESDWVPIQSYMVTPLDNTVELIDNNMRFQKLKLPIKEGFSWKGNSYIFTDTGSDYGYLDDWDYTYENVGMPYKPLNTEVDSTITVAQADVILDTDTFDETIYSKEVYGKGIGLIYKEFFHREYQAKKTDLFPKGYTLGYGIKLRMISHN